MKSKLIYIAVALCMILALLPAVLSARDVGAASTIQVHSGDSIQAAINSATAGDTILVNDGTYTEELTINKSVTIKSVNGSSVTIIDDAEGEHPAVTINSSNVTFGGDGQGFTIEGNDFGIGIASDLAGSTISRVTVQGNEISASTGGILSLAMNNTLFNNTITNNTVSGASYGIYLNNTQGTINGNSISGNNVSDFSEFGIFLYDHGNYMSNNSISGNNVSDSLNIGIYLENYGGNNMSDNSVDGNNVSACNYYGIYLYNDGNYTSNNSVDGNTVSDCGDGIYLDNDNNDMYDNSVDGNNVSDCSAGIYLDNSGNMSGNTLNSNTIHDCDNDGIYLCNLGADMSGSTITNNTIYACGSIGIDLANEGTDMPGNTINNNTIHDCDNDGIYLVNEGADMAGNTINNNTIHDCSMNGIEVHSSGSDMSDNTLNGNIVYNISYSGIVLGNEAGCPMPGNIVNRNTIYDVSDYGIYLYNYDNMSGSTINNNTIYNASMGGVLLPFGGRITGLGIYIYNCDNMSGNTLNNNTIHECDNYGIYLDNYGNVMSYNSVDNNTVYDCFDTGIYLYDEGNDISNSSVDGNTVYNCSTYGIYLYNNGGNYMSNSSVDSNNVYNCSQDGIYLYNHGGAAMSDNSVDSNNVSDCVYGIELYNVGNYMSTNSVDGNTVYNCSDTGIYLLNGGASMYDNSIVGNTVYNCSAYGIDLYNVGNYMSNNSIAGNIVYNCNSGILLYNDGNDMYDNSIAGNTIYNCDDGIYLENDGDMSNNSIAGNNVHNCDDGIYLYNEGYESYIEDNSITGNTVYDCDNGDGYGIYLRNDNDPEYMYNNSIVGNTVHDCSEGLYLESCEYTLILSNTIHHNSKGIDAYEVHYFFALNNTIADNYEGMHLHSVQPIYVYGNDILDNVGGTDTGIYLYDTDGYINCNNIVGNQPYGVLDDSGEIENHVDIGNNWWGDPGGPGADENNDGIYGDDIHYNGGLYDYDYYLETEYTPLTESIVNTASVPATVSLYDAFNQSYGYTQDLYNLGPSETWPILETTIPYCEECEPSYATLNLSVLLLDMLPANFSETVSNWSTDTQEMWYSWLDNLSDIFMSSSSDGGTAFWFYRVHLEDILLNTESPVGGHSLLEFFEADGNVSVFNTIMSQELRLGRFEIPVTLTKAWPLSYAEALSAEPGPLGLPAEEYYRETVSTTIPLNVVDFQLPLSQGWNVRSTPLTLDDNYDTLGDIKTISGGLPGLQAVLAWNASSGWKVINTSTVLTPLEAYFIKMNESDQIGFIASRNASATPQRRLYAGWNAVGLAPDFSYNVSNSSYYNDSFNTYENFPFPAMLVQDALASVAGNTSVRGWLTAINMPEDIDYTEYYYYNGVALEEGYSKLFRQLTWATVFDNRWQTPDTYVTPGGGYWVFMDNAYTLVGNNSTPVPDSIFNLASE